MAERSPSATTRRRLLVALAAVVGVVLVVVSVQRILERRQEHARIEAMAERLGDLRESTERCRAQLAREEAAFQRYDRSLDSLRQRVDAYVSRDGRVPDEEYDAYMEVFDRYNEAVPRWETRADSLRVTEVRCRERIELHNALADSLRGEMERMGAG